MLPETTNCTLEAEPFPHLFIHPVFDQHFANEALAWLEDIGTWHSNKKEFYDAESFRLGSVDIPTALRPLVSGLTLEHFRRIISKTFLLTPGTEVEVWANRIVPGKGVGLHNDMAAGEVRITIQLNKSWKLSNGGLLVLFSKPDVHDFQKMYLPLHNSAVVFPTTEVSYHAVSDVSQDVRYTLVYLFRSPSVGRRS